MQKQYQYLSYALLLLWMALIPVVPVSLLGLLMAVFGFKWWLLLLKKSPGFLIKFAWMSLSLAFMHVTGLLNFSVNGFIHLAMLGVFLKFLEIQTKKDMLSLLHLLIFVGVTPLLLDQEILQTFLVFLVFLFTLNNVVVISQSTGRASIGKKSEPSFFQTLIFSATQLAICLPIMLILFLIFPRLPPLWVMPDPENTAKTGLSSSMSPGSIAHLATSNERAFRVNFLDDKGELITDLNSQPAIDELYWRVLTMDRYDGKTWYKSEAENKQFYADNRQYSDIRRYRLYMDKTASGWLAILNRPTRNPGIGQWQSDSVVRLQDSELASKKKLFIYEGETSYQAYRENSISSIEYAALLQLPGNINPRTRELAESLRFLQSTVAVSDGQFVNNVLQYFMQGFTYTLQPPLLTSTAQIDQFLFDSQQGFCGHYASALAVMARMQGIPARIVNGYLGGTFNPHGGFWEIQQREAHAWVELYYDKQWHRVDPTAVVSDVRMSQGMDSLIAPTRNLMEKVFHVSLLIGLQQRLQAISHFWDQKVLAYDGAAQTSLIHQIMQGWKKWRQWFYLTLIIIVVAVCLFKPQWIKWLVSRFYKAVPVHRQLMNTFDRILFKHANENAFTLDDIHKMSINERKMLVKQGSAAAYHSLSLHFLTEYQQWRFHPKLNGATKGEGRKVVIRLQRILRRLAKLKM